MGLEEVKDEILNEANKESERLLEEAKQSSDLILEDAKKDISSLLKKYKDDISQLKDNLRIRESASSTLEAKRAVLDVKKDIIEEVKSSVKEELQKLPSKNRKEIISSLFDKASLQISIGDVIINKKDSEYLDFKNKSITDISGGIIVTEKSKKVSIDLSFDSILNEVFNKNLGEVSKILFPN